MGIAASGWANDTDDLRRSQERFAELACVADIPTPHSRRHHRGLVRTTADDGGALARQRPKAQGKTLFASARKLILQVIGETFAEAHRRDPGHVRPMLAVVDGNNVRLREPPRPACADTGRI